MRPLLLQIIFIGLVSSPVFGQELFFNRVGNFSFNRPLDLVSTGMVGDDRLFVVEKNGSIRIIDNISTNNPTVLPGDFLTVSVNTSSEGGLLGLVFDPGFSVNGFFYVAYTSTHEGQFTSIISRFSVNNSSDNQALNNSEDTIMMISQPFTNHNGGDLAFSTDGFLFIGLGDGGDAGDPLDNGQDSTSLLGSILRIDVSTLPYTIPPGNPYIGNPQVPDEIWSIGWRNPWRFTIDPATGLLIAGDVGQNNREEINIVSTTVGGKNYGWNCYEGSASYDLTDCGVAGNYTFPAYEYSHALGNSVTGGVVYRGTSYPALQGKYIFTDFIHSEVFWILSLSGNTVVQVDTLFIPAANALTRVASIGTDNRGEMYAAEYSSGELYAISSSVLPVHLVYFSGEAFDTYNLLEWEVLYEHQFSKYHLERKVADQDFQVITKVEGQAIDNKYTYQFADPLLVEEAYYRLKMIDINGDHAYSPVIKITRQAASEEIVIYPNPVSHSLQVEIDNDRWISYAILDLQGSQVIAPQKIPGTFWQIPTVSLSPGIYILEVFDGYISKYRKFIVTH